MDKGNPVAFDFYGFCRSTPHRSFPVHEIPLNHANIIRTPPTRLFSLRAPVRTQLKWFSERPEASPTTTVIVFDWRREHALTYAETLIFKRLESKPFGPLGWRMANKRPKTARFAALAHERRGLIRFRFTRARNGTDRRALLACHCRARWLQIGNESSAPRRPRVRRECRRTIRAFTHRSVHAVDRRRA